MSTPTGEALQAIRVTVELAVPVAKALQELDEHHGAGGREPAPAASAEPKTP